MYRLLFVLYQRENDQENDRGGIKFFCSNSSKSGPRCKNRLPKDATKIRRPVKSGDPNIRRPEYVFVDLVHSVSTRYCP
jgi:hypothetical protein